VDGLTPHASLLELLHPNGRAASLRVIGGNCPPDALVCPQRVIPSACPADLVVLAPTAEECGQPGWIERAAVGAAACVAADGVLYMMAAPRWRSALAQSLRRQGLQVEARFHHHPHWRHTSALIPMQARTLAYAYTRLILTDPMRRHVALRLLALPGASRVLSRLLPSTGYALRRVAGASGNGDHQHQLARG
jgi:hypothetical protein